MIRLKFYDNASYAFYASEKISPNRYITPEGFLLCPDVKIARIGDLEYKPDEIDGNIEPNADGIVILNRSAEDFFCDSTIASFEGKPIVSKFHQTVDPDNFKEISVGNISHVRREGDYLVADLLICDAEAIELVENNIIKEISIGYDADVEKIDVGKGRQFNIIGNHVALVREGRAGPSCSIGDAKPIKEVNKLAGKTKAATQRKKGDAFPIELRSSDVTDGNEEKVTFGTENIAQPTPDKDGEGEIAKTEVNINVVQPDKPASEGNASAGDDETTTDVNKSGDEEGGEPAAAANEEKIVTLDSIESIDDLEEFIIMIIDKYLKSKAETGAATAGDADDPDTSTTSVVVGSDNCTKGDSNGTEKEGATEVEPVENKTMTPDSIDPDDPDDVDNLPDVDELSEGVAVITPEIELGLGDAPTAVIMRDAMLTTIERYRRRDAKMDNFIRTLYGKKYGDSLDKLSNELLTGLFITIKEACKVNNNERFRIMGGKKSFGDSQRAKKPTITTAKDLAELYKSAHKH